MPSIIPFTSEGNKKITIALGENVFILETYYLPNIRRWLLDIYDIDEKPILTGISLNVGVGNLVKGKSALFEGQAIRCISMDGNDNTFPDSLGKTCIVLYYAKGEDVPEEYQDKMVNGWV